MKDPSHPHPPVQSFNHNKQGTNTNKLRDETRDIHNHKTHDTMKDSNKDKGIQQSNE